MDAYINYINYQLEDGASHYGAVEAHKLLGNVKRPEKKPASISLILGCLFVPLLIFIATYYMMSFYPRYLSNYLAYGVAGILLLVSLGFGVLAFNATEKTGGDPLWLGLLSLLCVVAWIWAFLYGNSSFYDHMQPYYDLQQLNVYQGVDPSTMNGNQFMDFGILGFVESASVARNLSMAFKNGDTYCAAPLRVNASVPESYDFWAVGINCCSSQHDYNCGEFKAHSGLRVARESLRSFYQLTVQQAAATYDIPVNNPIYFEMVTDPADRINGRQDEALKNFLSAGFCFLCVEAVVVFIAAFAFSKA